MPQTALEVSLVLNVFLSNLMQHQTADDDSMQDDEDHLTVVTSDNPANDDSVQKGQDHLTVVSGDDPVPVCSEEDPKPLFTSVTISDTVTAKEPGSTGEYTLYVIEVSIYCEMREAEEREGGIKRPLPLTLWYYK